MFGVGRSFLSVTFSNVRLRTCIVLNMLTALRGQILFFQLSIRGQNDFRQKTRKKFCPLGLEEKFNLSPGLKPSVRLSAKL